MNFLPNYSPERAELVTGYWGYHQMLLVPGDQLVLTEAPQKIEEQG